MKSPNDRSGRIEAVKSKVKDEKEIKKSELKAQASLELEVRQEKVEEYLDLLKQVGDVNEVDEKIIYQGD